MPNKPIFTFVVIFFLRLSLFNSDFVFVLKVLAELDGVYTVRLIVPGIGRRPDYSVAERLLEMGLGKPVEGTRQLKGRYCNS